VEQVNPDAFRHTAPQAYDPHTARQAYNSRLQLTAQLAKDAHIPIMLNAAGDVVEATSEREDPRLKAILQAHGHPTTQEELNDWAEAAGLATDQRMALYAEYQAKHGPLPSTQHDDQARKQHTLGSLGLRRATRLTQAQFAERLKYHGVPADQHMKLALLAYEAGHLLRDDESEQAHTFHPAGFEGEDKDLARQKRDLKASMARAAASVYGPAAAARC
jgi:hypothetical protein